MLPATAPAFPEVEEWLLQRQFELQTADLSLQAARAAMIRAYKLAANPHEYGVGDFVQAPARVLPMGILPHRWLSVCPRSLALSK